MARVSNTLIGKASGSVGNATFSTWKGINVLKEKAVSVANPNTDLQIMRRSALSQTVIIFRLISAAVALGFKKLATGMSAYNAFASNALKFAYDFATPPTAEFVPSDLLVSKGTISTTPILSLVADRSSNSVAFTFSATVDAPGQSLTDKTGMVAFNETKNLWISKVGDTVRSAGTDEIVMPAAWAVADVVQGYLFFYNEASGESSDSITDDVVVVA